MIELPDLTVLAIDPACHWGAAIATTINGDIVKSMHCHASREFKRGRGSQLDESIERIVEWVEGLIYGGCDELWIEVPTPASPKTAVAQGEWVAIARIAGERLGASPITGTAYPSTLKKWATGHGHADKSKMIAAANRIAEPDTPIVDDNEADAVCLAAYAVEQINNRERLRIARKLQRESEAAKA